jgi:hypothetical protein
MKLKPDFWRLYFAVVFTGLGVVLFAYVAVQQTLRLGANQTPQQLAEDAAVKLANGMTPGDIVGSAQIDEAASLSPFVTIVDSQYHVLASSGVMDGQVPLPPTGVFQSAGKSGLDRVTWQHAGIRDAAVIVPARTSTGTDYVLAAHSLRLTEATIDHLTALWFATVLGILIAPAVLLLVF